MTDKNYEIISEDIRTDSDKIIELKNCNEQFFIMEGRRKKYHILTYGCQMNEHDSEKIAGMLTSVGYEETDDEKQADLVIFNTCLIRENAELRVFGKLGEVKGLKQLRLL